MGMFEKLHSGGASVRLTAADHCGVHTEYGAPMDEQEMDRIDMAHAKYYMLLEKKRWLAPISANTQKVLDLGCETGTVYSPRI